MVYRALVLTTTNGGGLDTIILVIFTRTRFSPKQILIWNSLKSNEKPDIVQRESIDKSST